MALIEQTLFGEINKVETAIDRIKFAYEVSTNQDKGDLYVCFSGGKDSVVLAELCRLAKEKYGIEYTLNYNITGIDPPEVVYFMRKNYPNLIWHKYRKSMFELIVHKHMPPTRIARYCCSELKEHGGGGKVCLTGVRWAESVSRSRRRPFENVTKKMEEKMLFNDNDEGRLGFEQCQMKKKFVVNPIIDWTDEDVWQFIKERNLPYCELYDTGDARIGCIGCPLSTIKNRETDFERYPKFKQYYINAFDKMLENMTNTTTWKNGEDVFDWWLYGEKRNKPNEGQMELELEKEDGTT